MLPDIFQLFEQSFIDFAIDTQSHSIANRQPKKKTMMHTNFQ